VGEAIGNGPPHKGCPPWHLTLALVVLPGHWESGRSGPYSHTGTSLGNAGAIEMAPTPVEDTLALVEGLAKIASKYRLDAVKVGDLSITRTQHITAEDVATATVRAQRLRDQDEDDILFYSAGES